MEVTLNGLITIKENRLNVAVDTNRNLVTVGGNVIQMSQGKLMVWAETDEYRYDTLVIKVWYKDNSTAMFRGVDIMYLNCDPNVKLDDDQEMLSIHSGQLGKVERFDPFLIKRFTIEAEENPIPDFKNSF